MRTVKEVSSLTGISVRTLHYYDEIGILKPSGFTEAGYRLYDDKALEILRQILFFREFDMPLRKIKEIMQNPDLDQNQLLMGQRKLLVLKKERLERIIASMDAILKGDNRMNFEVFNKEELEQMYHNMVGKMSQEQKEIFIREYGSMEQFEKNFMENAAGEKAQKNMEKVVEWYGDKEGAMNAVKKQSADVTEAWAKRLDAVTRKLAAKLGADVHSLEVREIVGEMDFVCGQMYQMKDASRFLIDMAKEYLTNQTMQENMDKIYGEGTTKYIGEALEAFYRKEEKN